MGWRFTAAGLRRFGVRNVTIVDPPWEPRQRWRMKFHLIRDELIPDGLVASDHVDGSSAAP